MPAYATRAMERGGSMDNPNTASFAREIKLEQQLYDLQQVLIPFSSGRDSHRLERALGIAKEGLEKAIETIEAWHNMHLPFDLKDGLWERYQQSPEMKRINAALKAATEEMQK